MADVTYTHEGVAYAAAPSTAPGSCTRCAFKSATTACPPFSLSQDGCGYRDIIYIKAEPAQAPIASVAEEMAKPASGGAKLKGNHYYRVDVSHPISDEVQPYTAECADIIEALGMTFNEGEAFKALWRLAAGRTLGLKKNDPQYDADKAAHYGARVAVQTARQK